MNSNEETNIAQKGVVMIYNRYVTLILMPSSNTYLGFEPFMRNPKNS